MDQHREERMLAPHERQLRPHLRRAAPALVVVGVILIVATPTTSLVLKSIGVVLYAMAAIAVVQPRAGG